MHRPIATTVARPLRQTALACALLACLGALTSCGSDSSGESAAGSISELDEAQRTFDAAVGSSYELTFEYVGSASVDAGPVRVDVVDGQVVDADYPDPLLETVLTSIPFRTVAEMFDRARTTLEQGGLVEVTFDESYGHPTLLTIDPVPDAIDDEYSVRVVSVEPKPITEEGEGY